MKLFTFSRLWIPNVRIAGHKLLVGNAGCRLQIGSPMQDEFVQNFVLGLFESSEIVIGGQGLRAVFQVEQVEALALPIFQNQMRFKCLSPITASTAVEQNGRLKIYYYRPHDGQLSEALRQNLLEKHAVIHGKPPADSSLTFRLEAQDRPKSKLIAIKAGTPAETRIKAFESYFTLQGSPELMQVAWECGLGEHNSQGFGMVGKV